uniref:Uncharacterized protein n=1 Tax=Spongospora subterranea TaxID=70186 RepID=A0A0H5RAG7_9EUKA|eukprot:CRZ11150.1 hypothetical protein [Spongospora subterranea]
MGGLKRLRSSCKRGVSKEPKQQIEEQQQHSNIVHHDLLYRPPSTITCIAVNGDRIAAVRANGRIEIGRRVQQYIIVDYSIAVPGKQVDQEDYIITCACWQGSRLFTGDLDGTLIEWDLAKRIPRSSTSSYGGAIFSMAISGSCLALGCADGSLRLFDLNTSDVVYKRALLTGHISTPSSFIAAVLFISEDLIASADSDKRIHIFNMKSGQSVSQIITPSSISAMCLSSDKSLIISGSSEGQLQFWCLSTFTLVQTLTSHSANITSIIYNGDEIIACGLDRKIVRVCFIDGAYVISRSVRRHQSDVLCAASSGDVFITAGHDAQICVNYANTYCMASPFPDANDCSVSTDMSVMAFIVDSSSIHIWKYGKLVQRYCCRSPIVSMRISPDAKVLMTSTSSASYCIDLIHGPERSLNMSIRQSPPIEPAAVFCFSSCSTILYFVGLNGDDIYRYRMADMTELDRFSCPSAAQITRMIVSSNNDRLAVADVNGIITVFKMGEVMSIEVVLPAMPFPVSTMAFSHSSTSQMLAVITANNSIHIFSMLETRLISKRFSTAIRSSHQNVQSRRILERGPLVFQAEFSKLSPDTLLLVSPSYIAKLNLSRNPDVIPSTQSLTQHRADSDAISGSPRVIHHSQALQLIDFSTNPISSASSMGADINVLETSWGLILPHIKAPIETHRYANTI